MAQLLRYFALQKQSGHLSDMPTNCQVIESTVRSCGVHERRLNEAAGTADATRACWSRLLFDPWAITAEVFQKNLFNTEDATPNAHLNSLVRNPGFGELPKRFA